ncbi:MAG: exodeoxyribonuclease VII large subunit, partial [Pseudomonadota bacterium]
RRQIEQLWRRIAAAAPRTVARKSDRLGSAAKLLSTLSHQNVLERGFALVRDADDAVIKSAASAPDGTAVTLTFADGGRDAVMGAGGRSARSGKPPSAPAKRARQASFFEDD